MGHGLERQHRRFNLGNAIGAWVGGIGLSSFGLGAITWAAAVFPLAAIGIALLAVCGSVRAVPA